jgi:hypothetical protein
VEKYEGVRSDFLCYFNDLEEYCVSIEINHANKGDHLHAYLCFKCLLDCEDIRNCLSWFEGTVNVQNVKSKRNVLKYITKEDDEAFFNIAESQLSFYYRSKNWARRTRTFRYDDPFVLEYPQYYRLLSELHREVSNRPNGNKINYSIPNEFWPGWCMQVLLAVVSKIRGKSWKALYIYGESGVGKSFIVERCLGCFDKCNIYLPLPGRFFFGDFIEKFHDVVLFEEFDFDVFRTNFSQIKRITEGKCVSVDQKFGSRRVIRVKCLVIFVSNYEPYNDLAFLRRLEVINGLEKMESYPKVRVPKEEVDGFETEVIEIESDTDDEEMDCEKENIQPNVQTQTV